MNKTIWTILILFFSSFAFGQKFEQSVYDSIINYKTFDKELRIKTDVSVLNEYELIRIYQDSSKTWYLEKYLSNGQRDKYIVFEELDEFDGSIKKDSMHLTNTSKIITKNLGKKFYKTWLELLTTNILELPNLQSIEYKLGTKKVIEENGEYEMIEELVSVNDGIYYIIEVKDKKKFNRIEIDNPDFYIDTFPEIDEFEYIDIFLNMIKEILKNN